MSYVIVLLILIAVFIGLSKLFPLAGHAGWKAFIPGYNFYIWLQIIQKPWWWLFLLIFPGPNVIMFMVMCVNTGTVFGYIEPKDVFMNAFLPFYSIPKLGFSQKQKYVGPINREKFPKTSLMEWRDAILFAVVAASIIRSYTFEAFTIPTGSMEKSLLIGDYLFVNKMAYGPKVPMTPLAFPFAHHSLPATNNKVPAYLNWIKLPFMRLPGYSEIKRNDVVVFNYPEGDTVDIELQSNASFNALIKQVGQEAKQQALDRGEPEQSDDFYYRQGRNFLLKNRPYTIRPIDKRENYIKRCVAIAGDEIEIKDGILMVNGSEANSPTEMQFVYFVKFNQPKTISSSAYKNPANSKIHNYFKNEFNVNYQDLRQIGDSTLQMPLTVKLARKMEELEDVVNVTRRINPKPDLTLKRGINYTYFPNHKNYNWTEDNFGPLVIPKKGTTIEINKENLPIYERLISVYENNKLEVKNNQIFINGEATSSYTFKMNYYWLMGDNRHNSADSRFWGFVPEDHVVGKASFVWLSIDPELSLFSGGLRFDKMFRLVE